MASSDYLTKRNAYSYPAVGLSGCLECWTEISFPSTYQLDCYQNTLLMSDQNEETVLGYLSTIFWGYYSGKDQKIRSGRAQGKVRLALDGKDRKDNARMRGVKDRGVDSVAHEIRASSRRLMSDRYAEALELLCNLPQLRPAFASKVCAFLAPTRCGVIDSVIVKNYPRFGFSVDGSGYVANTPKNRRTTLGIVLFCKSKLTN